MSQIYRLDQVAEISAGNSAPQDEALFKGGSFPFVRTSDVGAIHLGTIATSRDLLTENGIKGLKLHPTGTILFPKSGASTFLNHRVMLAQPAYVSSHLATIKVQNGLALDGYVYYFLQTIDARDLCQDQSYPSLNRDQIASIEIPLPSLNKQREIVEKLDSALAEIQLIVASTEKEKSESKELFRQICNGFLQKLDPTCYSPLRDLSQVITKGTTPTSIGQKFVSKGINFLKVESLNQVGGFVENKFAFIDAGCHQVLGRSQLQNDDLLVSIAGALGRTAIVTDEILPANINQALALVRLPGESRILPQFIYSLFQAGFFDEVVLKMSAGAAQQNISLAQIGSLQIPMLASEQQLLFIDFIANLMECTDEFVTAINRKKELLHELNSSVLSSVLLNE